MGTILLVLSVLGIAYGVVGIVLKLVTKKIVKNYQENPPTPNRYGDAPSAPKLIDLPFHLATFIVSSVIVFLFSVIVKVGAQDVGVLCTPTGVKNSELHTGWHFVAPWNFVNIMDKTVWVYTCANSEKEGAKPNADAIWAPTKDGIKVGFDISVSWRINPDEASWIYQNVTDNDGGSDGKYIWLEENVIRTKLKSALALTVANYTPIEVYSTKRGEIQQQVFSRMQKESMAYQLKIEQIDLREVYYNADY